MDVLDRLAEEEEFLLCLRISQRQQNTLSESALECVCGADIPNERRIAVPGVQRCIDCQTRTERRRALFR